MYYHPIDEKTNDNFEGYDTCENYKCPNVKFDGKILKFKEYFNNWTAIDGSVSIFRGCSDFFMKDIQNNSIRKLFAVYSRCLPDIATFNRKICPASVSFGSETLVINSRDSELSIYQNARMAIKESPEAPGLVQIFRNGCRIATAEAESLNWCVGDLDFVYNATESSYCPEDENAKFATGLSLHEINTPDRECPRSCFFFDSPDLTGVNKRRRE